MRCRFCDEERSEDSLEHFLVCKWVHSCFPACWKQGATVPAAKFFLLMLSPSEKVAMSIFIFALYTICNEIRHCNVQPEAKQALWRVAGEVYLRPFARKAWNEFFLATLMRHAAVQDDTAERVRVHPRCGVG